MSNDAYAVVIGAGLFGSIIAKHLRHVGLKIIVIDDDRPLSGSKAAGCVIKPSWLSSFGKELDPCIDLLEEHYTVINVRFKVRPTGIKTDCKRIEPTQILKKPNIKATVSAIRTTKRGAVVVAGDKEYSCDYVIVAAGIWSNDLFTCDVSGRYGWSFRASPVRQNIIDTWAPYRQVVAFNMLDGNSWIGDGTALVEKSIDDARQAQSMERCAEKTKCRNLVPTLGARPYIATKNTPCTVRENGRVILASGGAKSGTVGAAWAALRIQEIMGV